MTGGICWSFRSKKCSVSGREDFNDLPGSDEQLEPGITVGDQIAEVLQLHEAAGERAGKGREKGLESPALKL